MTTVFISALASPAVAQVLAVATKQQIRDVVRSPPGFPAEKQQCPTAGVGFVWRVGPDGGRLHRRLPDHEVVGFRHHCTGGARVGSTLWGCSRRMSAMPDAPAGTPRFPALAGVTGPHFFLTGRSRGKAGQAMCGGMPGLRAVSGWCVG